MEADCSHKKNLGSRVPVKMAKFSGATLNFAHFNFSTHPSKARVIIIIICKAEIQLSTHLALIMIYKEHVSSHAFDVVKIHH